MQLPNLFLLLPDSDTVSWRGFRHLLCVELLHLGKALIRSGKCLPPLSSKERVQQGELVVLCPIP